MGTYGKHGPWEHDVSPDTGYTPTWPLKWETCGFTTLDFRVPFSGQTH